MVFVNSSFEDVDIDIALPKKYTKNISKVESYRTDARHDLAKTITGEGTSHVIGARGLTTVVFDLKKFQ
jgi:hypothetical protein